MNKPRVLFVLLATALATLLVSVSLTALAEVGPADDAQAAHNAQPPPEPILCDPWDSVTRYDFENDDGGFVANTPPGEWEWGALVPSDNSPPQAHSGSKLWATNLDGVITDEPSDHYLTKTIDLPLFSAGVLRWWDWWHEDGLDEGRVLINGEEMYFVGANQLAWQQHEIDLTPWQGQTVDIVFHYRALPTDAGGAGWYVDDVELLTCAAAAGPDLSLSQKEAPAYFVAGHHMTDTIRLFNSGRSDATNTQLVDPLPPGTRYVDGSATNGARYNAAANRIEWTGAIPSGARAEISYQLVADRGAGTITNVATVSQADLPEPLRLSATTEIITPAALPVCADFESGRLPPYFWPETTTSGDATGNVIVSDTMPFAGNYALALDTRCRGGCSDATSTRQAAIMAVDLAGQEQVELNFWVARQDDEPHAADGVFISNDGGATYAQLLNLSEQPEYYKNIIIDLATAAAEAGVTLEDSFLVKFQSYDNFAIPLDGYFLDNICVQRLQQAELAVAPDMLTPRVGPGGRTTQRLELHNSGGYTLTWRIAEAGATLSVPAAASPLQTAAPPPTAESVTERPLQTTLDVADVAARPAALPARDDVLYDQTNRLFGGVNSQQYEAARASFTTQAADDFVIPEADGSWTIRTIDVPGGYLGGSGPVRLANVTIYNSKGGRPASAAYEAQEVVVKQENEGALTIELPLPAVLPSGAYWLSVQAVMAREQYGQWFWLQNDDRRNSELLWRNPGDGFNTGCTDWTPGSECGLRASDLAFRLSGATGQCVPGELPWVQALTPRGAVPVDGTQSVPIAFTAGDLAPGTYEGNLCVISNDPQRPVTPVALRLTVTEQVESYLPTIAR